MMIRLDSLEVQTQTRRHKEYEVLLELRFFLLNFLGIRTYV